MQRENEDKFQNKHKFGIMRPPFPPPPPNMNRKFNEEPQRKFEFEPPRKLEF